MATTAPTNPNASSALQVWTPAAVQQLIADYPEDRFIALFPRTVLSQVNPMLSPIIETVVLNPDPENGGDVYQSRDLGQGNVALTKVALRRVMSLAGASMVDSRRMDDGSDPYYVLWQVTVERQVPGRPKPERAIGSKDIRLGPEQVKGWSPERITKAREHMTRMAEAKACNAALRDLLTLKQKYSLSEVRKPFVVLRWEPNMQHPAVAERFLDNLLPATTSAYGPGADRAAQLPAGEPAYELAPHVADDGDDADDTVHEGQFVEVRTNGHATVERATGEIIAERPATGTPDWFGADDAGPLDFGEGANATPRTLAQRLQAVAAQHADATDKPAETLQRQVSSLLGSIATTWSPGVHAAFGIGPWQLQHRHAAAILEMAQAMGEDAFRTAWVAMAAGS